VVRDPRGGHNRYPVNESFFQSWTSKMAYVLGFIYADGALIDARKSSRTQYLSIAINDKELLLKISRAMKTFKPLYIRKPCETTFFGKKYMTSTAYCLRIGNKKIFDDLIKLGLTPRKSHRIKFPEMPTNLVSHFIRGYFDGDGCLYGQVKSKKSPRVRVIFTSGSYEFLRDLSECLTKLLGLNKKKIFYASRSHRLVYGKREGLKLLDFCYSDLSSGLYLERKYSKYLQFTNLCQ